MTIRFPKSLLLSALAGTLGSLSADVVRVEATYVDNFAFENPITDAFGIPLTAGGVANDDGAVFQVGYFSGVSHLLNPTEFSEQDWLQFTPLTGRGSLNGDQHPTSIGGFDSMREGPFGFLFYPDPVAIELDSDRDEGVPLDGSYRFGIRFYDGTDMESSTSYNIVTSDSAGWMLEAGSASTMSLVLNMDGDNLIWASGAENAFQTSMPMAVPEPSVALLSLLGGLLLVRRRRVPAKTGV